MRPLVAVTLCAALIAGCGTGSSARRDAPTCPEGNCSEPQQTTTSYRKVQRDPDANASEPEVDASTFDTFDPAVGSARLTGDQATKALSAIEGSPEEPIALFRGDFASAEGEELFLVFADSVAVHTLDGDRVARREMTSIRPGSVRAVRLVDDRLEVVVTRAPDGDAAADELVVLRVIGRAVAEVFVASGPDHVDFVRRHEEKAIRIDDGDESTIHLWNEWEGVFRVPKRAPTAPK